MINKKATTAPPIAYLITLNIRISCFKVFYFHPILYQDYNAKAIIGVDTRGSTQRHINNNSY